jgi:hypothetical protein
MKMEVICSSETSVLLTGATRRHIPEDSLLPPLHLILVNFPKVGLCDLHAVC